MEARIARIEADVAHLRTDVAYLKVRFDRMGSRMDSRMDRLEARLDAFKDETHANFTVLKDRIASAEVRTLLLHFTLTAGLLGVMARGFGWI
jgi:hypothetical protein